MRKKIIIIAIIIAIITICLDVMFNTIRQNKIQINTIKQELIKNQNLVKSSEYQMSLINEIQKINSEIPELEKQIEDKKNRRICLEQQITRILKNEIAVVGYCDKQADDIKNENSVENKELETSIKNENTVAAKTAESVF